MAEERPNLFKRELELESDGPVYRYRAERLGAKASAQQLGATIYELPPGEAPWPIHYHLANEEMIIVLAGRPSLRTMQEERELAEGEVVARLVGERGACQIINRSDQPTRVLIVSEMRHPDIVRRPESGKLSAFCGRAPGSREAGEHLIFFERDRVGFWDGEEPPPPREG